jgi:hypothetical protein
MHVVELRAGLVRECFDALHERDASGRLHLRGVEQRARVLEACFGNRRHF